jgi:lambda family phage portal protein
MNPIDAIVAYFSPEAGVRRAQMRIALDQVRAYDAGKVGRRTAGWQTSSSSANVEIVQALERVRNRSRDMVRNNEYATRAIDTLTANTVGTGITVKMGALQKVWNRWIDYCDADGQLDFYGLQELAARTRFEAGEVLIRRRLRTVDDGFEVPFQLQVLEPDYLVNKFETLANGNVVIAGIEFDLVGRRVAYHLYRSHPGETGTFMRNGMETVRVPASEILHLYRKKRPQQVRGMPQLAVSMMRMRDLADYEDAELVRKKIEACFSVFVRTENDARALGSIESNTPDRRIEKIGPGMINYVKGAEEITFANPQANGAYGDYTRTQLHAIAVGTGCTYEQLTGDLSQVNFSSMRAGRMEFNNLIDQEQWLTFIPMVMKGTVAWFKDVAMLNGFPQARDVDAKYTPPKRQYIDPVKEVAATKEMLGAAMMSHSEALRERGYDPEEVWNEIAEEAKVMVRLGINPDVTVSQKLQQLLLDPPASSKH